MVCVVEILRDQCSTVFSRGWKNHRFTLTVFGIDEDPGQMAQRIPTSHTSGMDIALYTTLGSTHVKVHSGTYLKIKRDFDFEHFLTTHVTIPSTK